MSSCIVLGEPDSPKGCGGSTEGLWFILGSETCVCILLGSVLAAGTWQVTGTLSCICHRQLTRPGLLETAYRGAKLELSPGCREGLQPPCLHSSHSLAFCSITCSSSRSPGLADQSGIWHGAGHAAKAGPRECNSETCWKVVDRGSSLGCWWPLSPTGMQLTENKLTCREEG